jgi:hypothetical protein
MRPAHIPVCGHVAHCQKENVAASGLSAVDPRIICRVQSSNND